MSDQDERREGPWRDPLDVCMAALLLVAALGWLLAIALAMAGAFRRFMAAG